MKIEIDKELRNMFVKEALIEMRDESTRTVQEAEVWEEVEMIVDSGASGTVVGENMIKAVEAKNIKNDVSYKVADGSRVPHMGETLSQPSLIKATCAKWWPR